MEEKPVPTREPAFFCVVCHIAISHISGIIAVQPQKEHSKQTGKRRKGNSMTFDEFNNLYNNGGLKISAIYSRQGKDEFEHSYIFAFTKDGKYYLARYTERRYSAWSNAPKWGKSVKQFDTKEQANAYFKKCAAGYKKI